MSQAPLAYHITFGTYGARLHGGERPTVHWQQNKYGDPFVTTNAAWQAAERSQLIHPAVYLDVEQRLFLESIILDICTASQWEYHVAACQTDHFHILLTGSQEPKAIRRYLKRQLSQRLSEQWPHEGEYKWWAKGGSIKRVSDQAYFRNAFAYIERQRTTGAVGAAVSPPPGAQQ